MKYTKPRFTVAASPTENYRKGWEETFGIQRVLPLGPRAPDSIAAALALHVERAVITAPVGFDGNGTPVEETQEEADQDALTNFDDRGCDSVHDGWQCTRGEGHKWIHVAGGINGEIYARWFE